MKLRTVRTLALLLALIGAPEIGHAQEQSEDGEANVFAVRPTPEKIGPVKIGLSDEATGGCWTNLGEARTYASDKLIEAGYEVEDDAFNYHLLISVRAKRFGDGACVGYVEVVLGVFNVLNGNLGFHTIGSAGLLFVNPDNGNVPALDLIRHVVGQM